MSGVQRVRRRRAGFTLILTIALLALLVLAVYALSVLVRVDSQIVTASAYQVQARQHALLGLQLALGELQRTAGPDDRVTAMAGIAGEPGGSQRRHWCGAWNTAGGFLGWLVSGAAGGPAPSLGTTDVIALVERNSVGLKPATVNAYVDEEYVDAGRVLVRVPDGSGNETVAGSYAYWVGDEGVKISGVVSAAELPPNGFRLQIFSTLANVARVGAAFHQSSEAALARVLAYEQATNLFYAPGSRLTLANLRYSFHHVTRAHSGVDAGTGAVVAGRLNINTTSAVVWRSLIQSYELAPGAVPFAVAAKRESAIAVLANGIAGSASGKAAGAPFTSVEAFLEGGLLSAAVAGEDGITVAQFRTTLEPMLTVRSDTFRIRAYGEAVNPVDGAREAVAYCEAIVQRTPEMIDATFGRRFAVVYFRWLGPDDI